MNFNFLFRCRRFAGSSNKFGDDDSGILDLGSFGVRLIREKLGIDDREPLVPHLGDTIQVVGAGHLERVPQYLISHSLFDHGEFIRRKAEIAQRPADRLTEHVESFLIFSFRRDFSHRKTGDQETKNGKPLNFHQVFLPFEGIESNRRGLRFTVTFSLGRAAYR